MMNAKYHFMLAWLMCCSTGIAGQILSRNRPVYMSSQFTDWSGDRVVDGNNRTDADACGCCASTNYQTDPWITIDLGNTYLITRICVLGRTNHNYQNLDGLVFKLDDTSFTPTTDSTPTPIRSYTFILDRPTAAKNVTLMLPGENRILTLCEFDVFNDNVISVNKPITASSQFSTDWTIQGAVDGDDRTDGSACRCCAATKPEDNPWMRVDLGGYFFITYIIIYGRTDENITDQKFIGLEIKIGNGSIINVPDTDNYYDSGAMRVGPATYVKLQINGLGKYLVVCELQVFGECADGYIETDTTCQTVCPDGTFGTNCAYTCGQCRNGTNCNPIDGVCQQCEDGFSDVDNTCKTPCLNGTFGRNCSKTCGHCRDGTPCNRTSGACVGCVDGFDETDITCRTPFSACLGGTYGYNCTKTCGHCRDGLACDTTNGVCKRCEDGFDETDITCKTLCPNGIYGNNCSERCGQCNNGDSCNQTNGHCGQCESGYTETDTKCKTPCLNGTFGRNCSKTCGHCRDGTPCNRTNGACVGCLDGFDETDITCRTRCLGGTYGYNCTKTCGECRDGLACNTTNGVCKRCEDGFDETDITCKTPCPNGTYGNNCSEKCGQCINGESCNQTNGNCGQRESGYTETDAKCKTLCANSTYGNNCTGVCRYCKNRAICNKTNGVCDQCEDGYMETDMLCVERAENISRPLSSCPACPDSPVIMMIVGVTVATMLAIEGAAVVVICLVMKRKSLRKDNVGEPNPYELPDRSINEDEHQYESAMDMNVETPNYVNAGHRAI